MRCPFCKDSVVVKFKDTAFMVCSKCGLFINKIMTASQVKELNRNFLLGACVDINKRKGRIANANLQCAVLEKYISVGKLYDVGCSGGFFMKASIDRGWQASGNEVSLKSIEWAKNNYGFNIDYGVLEEIDHPSNYYDAVVLWNTLEHTHNPYTTIVTCYNMLRKDGLIHIKVPNKKTAKELKDHYERVHLFEFTDECLTYHLKNLGFEEIEMHRKIIENDRGIVAAVYLYRKV